MPLYAVSFGATSTERSGRRTAPLAFGWLEEARAEQTLQPLGSQALEHRKRATCAWLARVRQLARTHEACGLAA